MKIELHHIKKENRAMNTGNIEAGIASAGYISAERAMRKARAMAAVRAMRAAAEAEGFMTDEEIEKEILSSRHERRAGRQ